MPQFSVELSWWELLKLVLWWASILVSFHFGRFHGFQKVPEGHKESKVDEVNDVSPQVYKVKDALPQVFMTRKGTVLHSTSSCSYLDGPDTVAMNWCTSCKKVLAKRSKIA